MSEQTTTNPLLDRIRVPGETFLRTDRDPILVDAVQTIGISVLLRIGEVESGELEGDGGVVMRENELRGFENRFLER